MFLKSFEDHSLVITLRTGFVSLTLNKMSQNLSSLHLGLGLFHTASGAAARRQHRQWHASVSSLPQLYCSWWPSLYKESPTFTLTWHEFFFFFKRWQIPTVIVPGMQLLQSLVTWSCNAMVVRSISNFSSAWQRFDCIHIQSSCSRMTGLLVLARDLTGLSCCRFLFSLTEIWLVDQLYSTVGLPIASVLHYWKRLHLSHSDDMFFC